MSKHGFALATNLLAAGVLSSLIGCKDSSASAQHGYQSTNVVALTEASFSTEVMSSSKPVLVDFWAAWCGPCRVLAPTVDAVADHYAGRLKVGSVNVDDAPALAQRYAITAIPTILFVKDGKVVDRTIGLLGKADLQGKIDSLLAAMPAATNATGIKPQTK